MSPMDDNPVQLVTSWRHSHTTLSGGYVIGIDDERPFIALTH